MLNDAGTHQPGGRQRRARWQSRRAQSYMEHYWQTSYIFGGPAVYQATAPRLPSDQAQQ